MSCRWGEPKTEACGCSEQLALTFSDPPPGTAVPSWRPPDRHVIDVALPPFSDAPERTNP